MIVALIVTQSQAQINEVEEKVAGTAIKDAGKWLVGLVAAAGGAATLAKNLEKGEAAYALQFEIDPDAIRWERWIGWPNIFPILMVEGTGQYVVPEIFYNYRGGSIIWTFKVPKIPAGRSISVFILDDHSASDQIWNNILSTRWAVQLDAQTTMTQGIAAQGSVAGTLQLLDTRTTIVGPTSLCHYSVTCPNPWFTNEC